MKRGFAVAVAVAACAMLAVPAAAFGIGGAAVARDCAVGCVADPVCAAMHDMQARAADAASAAVLSDAEAVASEAEPVAPSQPETASEPVPSSWGAGFIDEDGNGICDRFEQGYCDVPGCVGHGRGYASSGDARGGAAGQGQGAGAGYVDADGDGICDNRGSGYGGGYGNGYGNGNGNGYGNGYGHHGGGHHGGRCW